MRKGHQDFVTVVSDVEKGILIEVIDSQGSNLKRDALWGGLFRPWGFQGSSCSGQFSHTWNNPLK